MKLKQNEALDVSKVNELIQKNMLNVVDAIAEKLEKKFDRKLGKLDEKLDSVWSAIRQEKSQSKLFSPRKSQVQAWVNSIPEII